MATLDDLLVPRDRDTIEALLLSTLQAEKIGGVQVFPVTDWYVGSVPRTIMKMIATGLLDRETVIGYIAAGGFLDLAAALTDPNGVTLDAWLEALAAQNFGVTRAAATFTKKLITITCASGYGPITRAAGELIAISQTGHYYANTASVTVNDGNQATAIFQAQSPGLIIDATGTVDKLVTPLPGISIADKPTQFSVPIKFWTGSGTIAVSSSSYPPDPPRTYKLVIAQSGRVDEVGAPHAKFTLQTFINGNAGQIVGPLNVGNTSDGDAYFTFTDGSAGTTSFVGGDVWFVTTPGEPTQQNGADAESLPALAQRCRDQRPALSAIPTESKYAAWVRQCSIDEHLGINRVSTSPSTTMAGVVDIYVADARGTAEDATVTALQNYLDKRAVDIERAFVHKASSLTINVTGKVYVKRSQMATVKAKALLAWNQYLASVPIGGEMPGHLVRVSKLDQILEDLGVYNSEELAINGDATDEDAVLASDDVAAASEAGTGALSWYEVP